MGKLLEKEKEFSYWGPGLVDEFIERRDIFNKSSKEFREIVRLSSEPLVNACVLFTEKDLCVQKFEKYMDRIPYELTLEIISMLAEDPELSKTLINCEHPEWSSKERQTVVRKMLRTYYRYHRVNCQNENCSGRFLSDGEIEAIINNAFN